MPNQEWYDVAARRAVMAMHEHLEFIQSMHGTFAEAAGVSLKQESLSELCVKNRDRLAEIARDIIHAEYSAYVSKEMSATTGVLQFKPKYTVFSPVKVMLNSVVQYGLINAVSGKDGKFVYEVSVCPIGGDKEDCMTVEIEEKDIIAGAV